ncbi:hypothetical protein L1987_01500 [Smallanthus sonchifolius]|uniref:Uncharacterized protein n=1 Tax=Smallanthus sonchifolius TaxID=185202 RepID=A0ACB9K5C8_9ASTR|nr:hypothetical protein L1987_01500 [Smallanthus sonchifolius]
MLQMPELAAIAVFGLRPFCPAVMADFGNFEWRMISSAAEPAAMAPSVKQVDAGTTKKEVNDRNAVSRV